MMLFFPMTSESLSASTSVSFVAYGRAKSGALSPTFSLSAAMVVVSAMSVKETRSENTFLEDTEYSLDEFKHG
jgi:hypothetical protein